jgi:signal peptidase I
MASETPKRPYRETLEALIIAAVFLRFANTFVVQTFYIPSESMVQTLLVGDHLFVNRFIYGAAATGLETATLPQRDVDRGDIVIFRSPADGIDLVKRCVGVAGDRVETVEGQLYINGREVDDEGYAKHRGFSPGTPFSYREQATNFGPYTVPEDHYFCMGDNRDRSHDSRFFGPVSKDLVKGRAFMVYWSFGGETPDGQWHGWGEKLAHIGKTVVGFPFQTRWKRTFQIVR